MQEVFVRVWNARTQLGQEASPTAWLYRVTTNYCLNQLRDGSRRRQLLTAEGAPSEVAGSAQVDDKLAIARVLGTIPSELAEIGIYYFVDQMNQDEIAQLIGVARRTVGNRLEEFRAAARAALGIRDTSAEAGA
jgi:RNA polymerase sigma-70 factor (ECF subfamily)